MAEPRLRGEERDAAIRAGIDPLGPGERPAAIVVSVAVSLLIAVGNLLLWATGWHVRGQTVSAAGAVAPALVFTWLAVGLWRTRLLAIAAMQVVLALTALFATGALLVASNLPSALLSVAVIAVCSALFWPLIRLNARAGLRDRVERHG
jgi:hypothetical protein